MNDIHRVISACHRATDEASEFESLDSTCGLWGEAYEASFWLEDECTDAAIDEALR